MEELRLFFEDLLSYVFSGTLLTIVTTIIIIVFWFFIGFLLIKLLNRLLFSVFKVKKEDKRTKTLKKLISSSTKIVVWFIIISIIFSQFGIDIAPFIASAGIVGVALGFGAQSIVKDFISGVLLLMEEAYYVDEFVEINGFKGIVIRRGLRSTSLQNYKGEIKIIGNGEIADLINFSRADSIALIEFNVEYDTDLKKLNELMNDFLIKTKKLYKKILEIPQFLGVTKLGDFFIQCSIIAKTVNNEQYEIERIIRADLVTFLNKNNIKLSFPQIVLHTKN